MEKGDNIQKQMGNVSWQMDTPRIKKKILEIKTIRTEIWVRDVFDGLISKLDTAKEAISGFEYRPMIMSQTEMQEDKKVFYM